jgi:glutathione peroxidase
MTSRQKILKLIYPLTILRSKLKNTNNKVLVNKNNVIPLTSVYDISFELNNNKIISLADFKNKKILIVNTASDCGYTKQYEGLEELYQQHKDKLVVIGFPSNDFGEQEKGSDNEIVQFCKINYGVTFPIAKKTTVKKSEHQNNIFSWLSDERNNGWLSKPPSWNFCKYLINEEGVLTHYFESAISPLGKEISNAIQK